MCVHAERKKKNVRKQASKYLAMLGWRFEDSQVK
jgi:hypothetical protein